VHEEINHDFPFLVTGDVSSELEDFAGKEPEAVSNGVSSLVVCWDGNIDVGEVVVTISKSDDGDVHVRCFSDGLVVKAGVADDDESGFEEPVIKYKLELNEIDGEKPPESTYFLVF